MSPADRDALFGTTWVHVFEQDVAAGAVYRPETERIPLSRRPRERVELSPDGSARVFMPGPDDRPIAQPAAWHAEDDDIVVRTESGAELRIIERSPTRLVIRASAGRHAS